MSPLSLNETLTFDAAPTIVWLALTGTQIHSLAQTLKHAGQPSTLLPTQSLFVNVTHVNFQQELHSIIPRCGDACLQEDLELHLQLPQL